MLAIKLERLGHKMVTDDMIKRKKALINQGFEMVPGTGVEPVQYFYRGILSPLCLPVPPSRLATV